MPDPGGAAAACRFAYETSVHEKAKAILAAHRRLLAPSLMAGFRHYAREGVPERWLDYTPVGVEITLADINRRPDVLVETVAGLLAVEIYVAHRSEPGKRAAFAARALASIEIDLSGYDRAISDDETALTEAVLNAARREWLFHPDKVALDAAYAAEIMEAERLAAIAEAERLAAIAEARRQQEAGREAARLDAARLVDERRAAEQRVAAAEAVRLAALAEADRERQLELAAMRVEADRLKMDTADRAFAEAGIDAQQRLASAAVRRAEQRRLDDVLALERAERHRQREILAAAEMLAKHDADGTSQRCLICAKPNSQFGFGLPPRPITWACLAHRAQVDALFVPSPYTPLRRSKGNPRRDAPAKPAQARLL
jgi:hypothetical protein